MGIFSLTTLSTMAEKAVKPYWQDVQVVEVNKEYPRTSFMTYNNRADALSGKFERSKYYRLLNGTWKFYLYFVFFTYKTVYLLPLLQKDKNEWFQ